jgi:hypothetical protein
VVVPNMPCTLPAEIAVTKREGVHYRLPPRELGACRFVGLPLLIPALILCVIVCYAAWQIVEGLLQAAGVQALLWLGGLMIGIGFLALAWRLACVGLFILAGRSEIELRDGVLYAHERCGPLCWTWERSASDLRRLFVSEGLEPLNFFGNVTAGPLGRLCAITPEWKPVVGGKPAKSMWLAPGYPRAWLLAVARDLAYRCAPAAEPAFSIDPAKAKLPREPIAVVQRGPDFSDFEELAEQPEGSRITVAPSADGFLVVVPPLLLRSGPGWLWGGLFLCFFAFAVSTTFFNDEADLPLWMRILLFAASGIVGIAFVAAHANLALRRVELAVHGESLMVWQSTLWGESKSQWSREQVADVFVLRHSDSEGPDHFELQIQPQPDAGSEMRLLAYQDPADLRWLATLLRRALRCDGLSMHSPPKGLVVRSPTHSFPRSAEG